MDSSGTGKENTIASGSVDSVPIQDSTIFSDISDLSPIKPFRGAPVAQAFAELSSPPLVFTSSQVNPQHQSSSLKRPQYDQISHVEISQQNDPKDAAAAISIDISGKPSTELSDQLNHSVDCGDGNNNSAHENGGSPFQSVDEYFAHLLEVDCSDTGHEALIQQCDKATSSSTFSDFQQGDIMNNVIIAVEPSSIIEQCREDCQLISSSYLKPLEGGEKENSDILNCFSVDHPSDDHNKHAETENAGAVHSVEFSSISQLLEEPTQLTQVHKDGSDSAGVVSVEQNIVLHDSKASQQHCGKTGRSLQFDGQQNTVAKSCGSVNQSNAANDLRSHATVSEVIESSCAGIYATPGSVEPENINKPILSMFCAPKAGKSCTAITKPSGIGLHLNSIVNCGVSSSVKAEDAYLNVQGKRSFSIIDAHLTENAVNSVSSKAVDSLSVRSEEIQQNSQASIISTSVNLSNQSPEPVLLNKSTEHHSVPCDKRKYKSSPQKKRKRSSAFDEGNGCKRCNCKKTKCLQLYCDCFAAGIYCAETCTCQGCLNSPEYEDTVLERRQQIESKNPFAFAPKIVLRVAKPPVNKIQDINKSTPPSARHKRGCNCKKSMCLKKYCECYQLNVGCSDGCRCDGCKNVYGKREEYSLIKHITINEAADGKSEISVDQMFDTLLHSELRTPHNLAPSTPSLQYSDHGKDGLYSPFPSGRYLRSPESDVAFVHTNEKPPDSPKTSDAHKIIQETGREISNIISSKQQLYSCNSERVDDFSSNQHGNNSLSMYHNPHSMARTSLVSPMTKVWRKDTSSQVCPGSGSFSSLNSFQLCSSPVTPKVTIRENTLSKVLDCGNKCYNIIEDDDTPEILKENPTPVAEVKVNSPNKKRVSPPHSRFDDIGSSSPITEVRSGRKFILKAVPSFPPLTPCIDAKSITRRSTNDLDSDNIK